MTDADEFSAINLDRGYDAIVEDVKVRLDALLRKYGCDPTPLGWRELALCLAQQYEPAMRIDRKFVKAIPVSFGALVMMRDLLSKSPNMKQNEAARIVARKLGTNAKTLQVRYSEALRSDRPVIHKHHLLFPQIVEDAVSRLESEPRRSSDYKRQLIQRPPRSIDEQKT